MIAARIKVISRLKKGIDHLNKGPYFRLHDIPSSNNEGFILIIRNEGCGLRLKQITLGDHCNFELWQINDLSANDLGDLTLDRNEELRIVCKEEDKDQSRNGEIILSFVDMNGSKHKQKISVSGSNAIISDSVPR